MGGEVILRAQLPFLYMEACTISAYGWVTGVVGRCKGKVVVKLRGLRAGSDVLS